MAQVKPSQILLEAQLNSAWVDIAAYQVGDVSGSDGFGRAGFMDRVASQGSINFKLNNLAGLFTYLGENQMAGWMATLPLRLNVEYDGAIVNVFTGRTEDLRAQSKLPAWLEITAYDWLSALSKFKIDEQEALVDLTIDDAIRIVLTHLPWQPSNLDLHRGVNTFPTVFDNIGKKGTPAGEIAKLVNSELGFLYMRRNETLVLEAMGERARLLPALSTEEVALEDELSPQLLFEDGEEAAFEDGELILFNEVRPAAFENAADNIPLVTELCQEIIFEDGEEALFEDGTPIAFCDTEEAVFYFDEYADMDVEYGPNHFNSATVTAYPRYTDDEPVRLYRLGTPLKLPAGAQVELKGSWTNPNSGDPIGGLEIDTPAQNTNYTANKKEDGTGTDRTAQLVIDSWEPVGNGFKALITSPAGGWLTKFDINGLGVYTDDQASSEILDTEAVERDGETSLSVDQPYLNDFAFSKGLVAAEMLFQRDKKREGTRIHLMANKSSKLMMAFLYLQTGSVIRALNERHEIDHFYTIYDREYYLSPAGLITYSWGIKRLRSQRDMTEVELQCAISSSTTQEAVALGALPDWASRKITFFCEVYVNSVSSAATLMSLPFLSGGQDTFLRLQVNSAGALLARTSQFDTAGTWTSSGDAIGVGMWVPVAVTYDSEALSNVPKFYINGALQSVTSPTQPTGNRVDEPLTFLELGGHIQEQSSTSYDIRVRRHRWFNDVMTAAEIAALSASPDDYSLYANKLLMGGVSVPNEYAEDWIDQELGGAIQVVDLVAASVNTEQSGAPTIREIS